MKLILIIVLGYLIGSVPFALVIGKLFFQKDIRQYGSGNLGGSNAGRVLGKRAGLATMALDLLKVSIVVLIAKIIGGDDIVIALGSLSAILGHCYPLFAQFHGGKAVASMYGMLFGLIAFAGRSPLYFLLPLVVFLIVLFLGRMSSLASMLSSIAVTIFIWLQPSESLSIKVVQLLIAILIVYRHRANIDRIRNHNENTVSWIPKL